MTSKAPREDDPRVSLIALWPLAVFAIGFVTNLFGIFPESWDMDTYGRLACLWFALGLGLLVWQTVARTFLWSVVLFALVLAAMGCCANLEMLARISASV